MSTEHDAFIGQSLGGYQIQSKLGEGGMATVYKAHDPRLRRDVAIKVIRPKVSERASFQARFEREAQVVANLTHPNIVNVYGIGDEGDITYLVMQYVSGGTLREQLRGQRPLDPQRATYYAIQMARALHHAHQRGIVHRDVKPQNMLVDGNDPKHLLLSDFGIAKLFSGNEQSVIEEMPTHLGQQDSSLTTVNQIIGTADYMSPEQTLAKPVDARTDVYALGIVLYQMLTGDVPFQSNSFRGLLFQQAYTPPPPARAKNPQVPEMLEKIALQAMAKAPEERFQTAEALALALEQANANATYTLDSFAHGTQVQLRPNQSGYQPPATFAPPPGGPQSMTFVPAPLRPSYTGNPQDSLRTLDDDRTVTSPGNRLYRDSGLAVPNRDTTGGYKPVQIKPVEQRRRLPLSYIMMALVVVVSLIVLGVRVLPGLINNNATTSASSSITQPFVENFSNNSRGWQKGGALNNGVQADISNNQYTLITSQNDTSFAYPSPVSTLPTNFTLTVKMEDKANAPALLYGLAFRFTQLDSSHVNCYTLLIDNQGDYQIRELGNGYTLSSQPLWSGTYNGSTGSHELKVTAQGNKYTFAIDGKAIQTGLNTSTLQNSDISSSTGGLALVVTGPGGNFEVDKVQLTTP